MKKPLILLAAFLFAFLSSKAQTEKGTQSLGANLGFSYNNSSNYTIYPSDNSTSTLNTKVTTFNIGPNYGYFIKDNLEIGAAIAYTSSSTTNNSNNFATSNNQYPVKQTSYNFGGTLFIRKYFMFKNKIGVRTEGYVGYSGGNEKQTYTAVYTVYNFNSNINYYSAGTNLDLVFYPSKKLGVAATLANLEYYHYKADNTTQGHDSGDNVTFNFINNGLTFSIFYVFSSK